LLGIKSKEALLTHPYRGAIWEGFALEQTILLNNARAEEVYFWRTHHGAELDLLILRDNQRIGYEFKFSDSPKITKSMHMAIQDLKLDHLYIIYPGQQIIKFNDHITAMGISDESQ